MNAELCKFQLNPSQLNNTAKAEMNVLVFNRCPKVGSQTMMQLMKLLSQKLNYHCARDKLGKQETVLIGPLQQQDLAEDIANQEGYTTYTKHVAFINFTKFGLPRPIYINLVRDPIERIISWFYYIRAPWYFIERKKQFPDIPFPEGSWLKKNFEDCVLDGGDKECTFSQGVLLEGTGDHRRQTLFFCGHDKATCLPFNSASALQRAKATVEQEYAVVGSWEDKNITLTVLEHYIPRFFKGATEIYFQNEKLKKINRNIYKPPVSEEIKNILRKNLTREIEFYQFCKKRLYKQFWALKLN